MSTNCDRRSPWWLLTIATSGLILFTAIAAGRAEVADNGQKAADHWAFQPVRRPAIPKVQGDAWVRTPIDAFVLARLEQKGWSPSPPASPEALLRRLHLDLIGLPPTLVEQDAFLADPSPAHLDRIADQLLNRPGYGERWGRHWLDLVRYAESNGYERDATKPFVWRYRDYVIDALNRDKPYDRFILEQIAGDELADATAETMIATGYLRLGPWDDEPADPVTDRYDQLDDLVSTTAQVFLGLTLGCARCHDHKFEPLTSMDYYRMLAVFHPLERPQKGRTELTVPVGSRAQIQAEIERDEKIEALRAEIDETRQTFRDAYLASGRCRLPALAVAAFRAPADKRTAEQMELAAKHADALDEELRAALTPDLKQEITAKKAKIDALIAQTPDLPRGYILHEPSPDPPATHLLLRGKPTSPGPEVTPGFPAILVAEPTEFHSNPSCTSRRRLSLARWIASRDNPLTARVIVNRVWQFHFGLGLVRTPSDFGTMGDEPTHPELLDWLAHWFMHEANGSLKKLHHLIVTSNTWRMSKTWNSRYAAVDPTNRFWWRAAYRRIEVEVIRDAMLAVSGQLNRTMYGPGMFPHVAAQALEGHSDPDKIWQPFDEQQASRRTIYAFLKRSMIVPMLEVLDLCDTTRTSAERAVTTVAPQALTLFNGEFVNRQARHFAGRLVEEVGTDPRRQIDRAFRLALARPPTSNERQAMLAFLERETEQASGTAGNATDPSTADRADEAALEQMCRVIFNLNEFVYPD